MAVAFRSVADVYTGTPTVNKPAGVADLDALVAVVNVFSGTPVVPADGLEGFTRVIAQTSGNVGVGLFYKKITNAARIRKKATPNVSLTV